MDLRAIPYLVSWLEDDFAADAASAPSPWRRFAFSPLIESLREKHTRFGHETGMSQRRRARILEILDDLMRSEEIHLIEDLLDDLVEIVRLNAARVVLNKGAGTQQEHAFEVGLRLLDSSDRAVRASSEEIVLENFAVGHHLVEQEIPEAGTRRRISAGVFPQGEHPRYPPSNSQERQTVNGGAAVMEGLHRVKKSRPVQNRLAQPQCGGMGLTSLLSDIGHEISRLSCLVFWPCSVSPRSARHDRGCGRIQSRVS